MLIPEYIEVHSPVEKLVKPDFTNSEKLCNISTPKGIFEVRRMVFNPNRQKFFYIIKVKDKFVMENKGRLLKHGMLLNRHTKTFPYPYSYFFENDHWD